MSQFRSGGIIQSTPPVVKNIIIINVLMVLLQSALFKSGINLADHLGLHYWGSPLYRWWQPFTHMFMHGDPANVQETIMHIAFNMLALWMFGRILENVMGSRRFLIFYIVCGLGAALCHMGVLTFEYTRLYNEFLAYQAHPGYDQFILFMQKHGLGVDNPQWLAEWRTDPTGVSYIRQSIADLNNFYIREISEPTVGASGAVFGVLFAFGYLFPNVELMLIFPPMPIKAKWVVGGYALIELYSGLKNSAGDNVAHFAHLGGMLFAFLLLKMWGNKIRNRYY
jgi:membrane associated rhomboid family serine protease